MDWTELGRVAAENLTPVALIILVGVVGAATKVGLAYLEKWTGAKVSQVQREMLVNLAEDAVYFAEEQARKALRAGDPTPDSDTKMETAFKCATDHAKDLGLPEMARDRLVELIESQLMKDRPYEEFVMAKKATTIDDPEDTEVDLPPPAKYAPLGKQIGGESAK